MKKFLIAAVAVATLAGAAGAASAAPARGYNINGKQQVVQDRIVHGERSGQITPSESRVLRAELRDIALQERQFRNTRGLDYREFMVLNHRIDRLKLRVIREAQDRQSYAYGYGRDHDRDRDRGYYDYRDGRR